MQHLSTIYFDRKKCVHLVPEVILQYKMHTIKNTWRWFGKVINNLFLRICYCYYCRKQGMVFQDVTFELGRQRLSCTIFLTADRWNLLKCRLLTTIMLWCKCLITWEIFKSVYGYGKAKNTWQEWSISSLHHLIYFLNLQIYFSAGSRP